MSASKFLLLVIAICFVGCSSGELTREKAAILIVAKEKTLYLYAFKKHGDQHLSLVDENSQESKGLLRCLTSNGLFVTCNDNGSWNHFEPKNQVILDSAIKATELTYPTFKFPVATLSKVTVTGIATLQQGVAEVTYQEESYAWKEFYGVKDNLIPSNTGEQKAYFKKYDDGWRLEM